MIYISILIYLALLSFLYEFTNFKLFRGFNKVLIFVILVSLAAFRFRVGGDTYFYMLVYEALPEFSNIFSNEFELVKLQPLWLFVNALAKSISNEFYVFQIFHALIVNTIIFYFFHKHSHYFFTSIFLYFFTFYPNFNFEILRESLAICVFLLGFNFLIEKKWIKYYLTATIAFLFHYSALLLFLVPLIINIKLDFKRLVIMILIASILNIFTLSVVQSLTGGGGLVATILTYADYSYTFFGYLTIIIINILYPFAFFQFYKRYKIISKNENIIVFGKLFVLSGVLAIAFYILFRTANYFLPFFVIIAVDIIHHVAKSKLFTHYRLFSSASILCMIFFLQTFKYFSSTSDKVESSIWLSYWVPYYSIFDPQTDPTRENLYKNL